jgi:hypothetical protein
LLVPLIALLELQVLKRVSPVAIVCVDAQFKTLAGFGDNFVVGHLQGFPMQGLTIKSGSAWMGAKPKRP